MGVIKFKEIENKIIIIQETHVIMDSDVAAIYGVETKRINEAVTRNSEKFPKGYIIELTSNEKNELVANCDRFTNLRHSTSIPKAFTEKGLYMLATILKSPIATQTTLGIIDTFAKIRELNHTITMLQSTSVTSPTKQKSLLHRAGELAAEVIIADEDFDVSESETVVEMGFPFFRIRKNIKKTPKK